MTAPNSISTAAPASNANQANNESLIQYPSMFPIKVVGMNVPEYEPQITLLAKKFDPAFDASTIQKKDSSGGKYLGLTIQITATSREQLDSIYRALTAHPLVKWVL